MLDKDKLVVKKTGIKEGHELHIDDKLSYVEVQITEMQKILWRMRVDQMILNDARPSTEEEAMVKEQKLAQNVKEIQKFVDGISSLLKIQDELEKWNLLSASHHGVWSIHGQWSRY